MILAQVPQAVPYDTVPFDPASAGVAAALAGLGVVFFVLALAVYLYVAFAMMKTAQRLKIKNAWLAFIPIGNVYLLSQMAGMHWWPILFALGILIPFVGFVFSVALTVFLIIWQWKVCEKRGKPGWWAVLQIIPVLGGIWGLIMWGILAWGD